MASRPIDEKIVAMKMDNSDFVKKATETTKSMGMLTTSLNKIPGINLRSTTSELQNIQRSVNGIETTRLSNAVDMITSRFSTLGIVATTVLMNITNRAVDAGLAMVKNMTIGPIMDGFREYELKMGSIQTILANTARHGTTLRDVTDNLEELNLYADRTIYSFAEMTKNIGLFTNAGLKLEESTSMIKGFANAAAASGAGATEMARAAYQLSQGLASGYILTIDWMSLTNAGMGNDNMKRDLIALGQAMGTLNKSTEYTIQNWKEILSDDKWLTKEVFSVYLQAMAGDIDKATLKTIGLTDAQADLLVQNAKTGNEAATYVRTFTQMMSTLVEGIGSGWAQTWEIIFGDFQHATKLWTGFSELISAPFQNLTESRNKFVQTLKDNGVFEELFVTIGTAIYVVGRAIGAMTSGFDKAFSSDRMSMVSAFVQGFKRFVSAITPSEATLDKLSTIFLALGTTVRVVMKLIGDLGSLFLKLIPDNLGTNILSFLESLAKVVIGFNTAILSGNGLEAVFEKLGSVFSWLGDRIGNIGDGFAILGAAIFEVWTILRTGQSMTEGMFNSNSKIVSWLISIRNACEWVVTGIKNIKFTIAPVTNLFNSFFSTIATGFNWLKEKLSSVGQSISESMPSGTTLMAGGFVAALTALLGVVAKRVWDISRIFGGWGRMVEGFGDTLDSVSGALDSFGWSLKANALLTAAIAVGVLAGAIMLLSRVDGNKAATSLTAIIGSLSAVIGAMAIMNKYDITGGLKTTTSIIGIAVALSVMSIALKKFGSLKPDELTKGLIGIVTVMAALTASFAIMGKFNAGTVATSSAQIVAMSVSVLIITKAIKDMGTLNTSELVQGIGGLAAIIVALTSAFALMGKFSAGNAATALQFIGIAASVLMLIGAIKMIAKIEPSDLLVGLGTITAILGVVAGFAALTSGKGLLGSAVGLVAISVALNSLLIPIFALGNFPLDTLVIGLVGMSAALLAIAGASKIMGGSLIGAVGITTMAVALNLLMVPIGFFAALGWGPMLTGIAGMALSLAALAGVSLLLSPATIPLLAFSGAIALMGLAMLAGGAGMALFASGLVALAGMTSVAIATIVATLGALITGIASLIPSAVRFVIEIIKEVVYAIRDNAPEILTVIGDIILKVLAKLAEYLPKFVKAAVKIIIAIIDAIAEEGPKLIASIVNLIINLVEGMAKTIDEEGPRFVNAFLDLYSAIIRLVVEAGAAVIEALFGWIPGVEKAMNAVSETASDAIAEAFDAAKLAEDKGSDFAKALASKSYEAEKSGQALGMAASNGVKSVDSWKIGTEFAYGLSSGMKSKEGEVSAAANGLASAMVDSTNKTLDVNSPGEEGRYSGEEHGNGLSLGAESKIPQVKESGKKLADGLLSGMGDTREKVRDMLFLKDGDVKENEKQAAEVSDSYSNISKDAEKSAKKTTKAQKDGLNAAFKASKEWIEDRKYFQKLTLDDELLAWQRIQNKYKVGSEERKQADREVFRVQQELIKRKTQAEKDAFDKSKRFIEDEKTFRNISTMEELSNWERVQKQYAVGTEQRKQADREVLRIKNDINQKLMSLNEEYVQNVKETNRKLIEDEKRLNDEYDRTYKDRVRSLTNFVGLFDKVKAKDLENPMSGMDLLENLRGQVNSLATWSDDLQRLSQKGIDEGLLKELQEMGPGAALEIEALNDLTAAQLDHYVELWRKKSELASTQATRELIPLREETNKQIEQLRKDTEAQLEEYKKEWIKKIAEIRVGTSKGFVGLNDDMQSIGEDAIKGLIAGLDDSKSPLYTKVQDIAKGIERTIKDTLKIKSPSRVMMGLGEFAGEGLAIGLSKSSGVVGDKSKELALKAKDSINTFLSKFQAPDFNNEIHFKAVLDDSAITNGAMNLGKNSIPYFLGTTNGLMSYVKAGFRQNGNNMPNSGASQVPSAENTSIPNDRPIVIQSILNGRVIAEETFNDINQLMGGRTNLGYAMRGV